MSSSFDSDYSSEIESRFSVLPRHVAIIMDGNSRWAESRGLPRIMGHREGAKAVKRCIKAAINRQIGWLTLYAFSSENWRRTSEEVDGLTSLLKYYLQHEVKKLHQENVRVQFIGDTKRFDKKMQNELHKAEALTKNNNKLVLTLALSYGGRGEILRGIQNVIEFAKQEGQELTDITEDQFSRFLYTVNMPDPDLILRTSGEYRLSNFLLWQSAYAELIFLDTLWPDFNQMHFDQVLDIYIRRERRFGSRPGLKKSE